MSGIVLFTGPSAVGKTSILEGVMEQVPELEFVPSYSTRPMREGESNGNPYFFVSRESFMKMKEAGEFIESFENYGNWYGTPTNLYYEYFEDGKTVAKAIDVRGAMELKQEFEEYCLSIYIAPPSMRELKDRMEKRDGFVDLQRYRAAKEEMLWADNFDIVFVNKDLEESIEKLSSIIGGAIKRTKSGGR